MASPEAAVGLPPTQPSKVDPDSHNHSHMKTNTNSNNNNNTNHKRPAVESNRSAKKQKSKRERNIKEGSSDEVLLLDVKALIKARQDAAPESDGQPEESSVPPLPELGSEIEVKVLELSSTGDGLAVHEGSPRDQIYVVPFVAPGDVARVRVYRHVFGQNHSMADFLSVVTPGSLRDDSRINCKYFASCSGCQFQMLDYADQLIHKRRIVEKAFRNFSQLAPETLPTIGDTIGSPLQFGYRTKLTPHFDGPPGGGRRKTKGQSKPAFTSVPTIGFNQKGRRVVLDIEDCPIGTDAVRAGMKRERVRMQDEFGNYKNGATLLLRESTKRYPKDTEQPPEVLPEDAVRVEGDGFTDIKTCFTDSKAETSEYIDNFLFTNPAGSFFQNNNSILPPFTAYIRDHVMPPKSSSENGVEKQVKHLIDAYSGSGLFTITLSGMFASSTGIDIAGASIEYARKNAALNHIPEAECSFMAADAPELFKHVTTDPDETVVVIDPPRKGCDASFLSQLLRFGPRRVVYVSCNVHTQARDVGVLVRGEVEGQEVSGKKTRYDVESIRGFDFFPQTGHVEGVAVLNRVQVDAA